MQLVISLPMIEAYANVLTRRLDYARTEAEVRAWLLAEYALAGPVPSQPYLSIGAGFIPFETGEQLRQSIEALQQSSETARLFHEVQDDRYVLETALVGRADILVTANLDDFIRGPVIRLQRPDVALFPFGDMTLVIAKPSFIADWLRQGVVPDAAFIAARSEEFPRAPGTGDNLEPDYAPCSAGKCSMQDERFDGFLREVTDGPLPGAAPEGPRAGSS